MASSRGNLLGAGETPAQYFDLFDNTWEPDPDRPGLVRRKAAEDVEDAIRSDQEELPTTIQVRPTRERKLKLRSRSRSPRVEAPPERGRSRTRRPPVIIKKKGKQKGERDTSSKGKGKQKGQMQGGGKGAGKGTKPVDDEEKAPRWN